MRSLVVVVTVVVAVAGCSYSPDSYAYPGRSFAGQRVTAGCLDLAIDRRADLDGRPVLDYQFGNRCDSSVVIDLTRARVVGRTLAGDEVALAAWDPRGEIVAAKLGARQAGGEAIAYASEPPGEQVPLGYVSDAAALAQVCVDVAPLDRRVTFERWVCFASRGGMVAEVTP